MITSLLQSLKRICRIGTVSNSGTNGSEYWIQQIEYLGKTSDCWFMFPYGMHAHLPPEDVLTMFLTIQGHEEAKIGMGWTPKIRPDLESGEVAYYHPKTDSIVTFKNNGDIDIHSGKDGEPTNINITGNNVNATLEGDINITVVGNATIDVEGDTTLDVGGNCDTIVGGDMSADVSGGVEVTAGGDVDVTASNVNIDAATTNLGVGGQPIARVGDSIQTIVAGGSSAGVHSGTIIAGGANTSI